MFPIGDDDVRGAGIPVVTWLLIALNAIVFVYEITLPPGQLEQFFAAFGVVPAQILDGRNLSALLTSMFLHGGWAHIIGNMLFLAVFGDNVEAILGKIGYLVFYLAGGLAASAAHIFFNANSQLPSLGASGALAAVLGAYVVMFPQAQVRVLIFFGFFVTIRRVTAVLFLGLWFLTQLLNGVASLGVATAQTATVAYWAHIGGFLTGLLAGVIFRGRAKEAALESPPRRRLRRW
jgi:membrane associated rhomboid family serine protease